MYVHPDFVLRKIYGKALLMPVRYNEACNDPVFLNNAAAVIWELASTGSEKQDIILKIDEMYGLQSNSEEEIAVRDFLHELIKMNLIFE